MQDKLKAKWGVTEEELKIARYELRVHALTGNYQSTKALSALLDVLENGDVPAEEKAGEKAKDGEQTSEPKTGDETKTFKITLEDRRDGKKEVVETDYAFLLTHVDDSAEGNDEKCLMHAYEWCNAENRVRISAGKALERGAEKVREKLISDLVKNYFSEGGDDE